MTDQPDARPLIQDAGYFVGILKPNLPEPTPTAVIQGMADILSIIQERNTNHREQNANLQAALMEVYEAGKRDALQDAIKAVEGIKDRFISSTKEGQAAIDTCDDILTALKSEG